MNAVETIPIVRQTYSKEELPVVLLSASFETYAPAASLMALGFNAVGMKPLTIPMLRRFLNTYAPTTEVVAEVEKPNAETLFNTRKMSMLVVEDDETSSLVMCRLLERAGYFVESAKNGALAVEKVKKHSYKCIMMVSTGMAWHGMYFARACVCLLIRTYKAGHGHTPTDSSFSCRYFVTFMSIHSLDDTNAYIRTAICP
jgi:CheY-like chemotaxis protein